MVEPELEDAESDFSPDAFYEIKASGPRHPLQGLGTPRYLPPRYARFRSEEAKNRFLGEALPPPAEGWSRSLELRTKHPALAFLDVWVGVDGRLRSMLMKPPSPYRRLRLRWSPIGAEQEEPEGAVWKH
jgi:hypothetical protein